MYAQSNHSFYRIASRNFLLALAIACSTSFASAPAAEKLNSKHVENCEVIGALSKAFAEARDRGMSYSKAQELIMPKLMQHQRKYLRTHERLIALTGGLAYTQKTLVPISVFSLSKYLCMMSYHKSKDQKIALKYLLESAKLCQERLQGNNKRYACMQLAYKLYLEKTTPAPPISTQKSTQP